METRSAGAFAQAKKIIPGGVNSPARVFGAVGGNPLFIDRGAGSRIVDIDGREYIDYVWSWGPLIFGHAHPRVQKIAIEQMGKINTNTRYLHPAQTAFAKKILSKFPEKFNTCFFVII